MTFNKEYMAIGRMTIYGTKGGSRQTQLSEDGPAAYQSWCPTHGTGKGGLFQILLGFQVTVTWFPHMWRQLCVLQSLRGEAG